MGNLGSNAAPVLTMRPQRQVGPQAFAREMYVRLPYTDFANLVTGTGGTFVIRTFNLNSLASIIPAGGGHQPRQFDQLSGIYRKYWVSGVKVTITATNPNVDGLVCAYALRARNILGIDGTTVTEAAELQNCRQANLHNTGSQTKQWSFYVDIAKLCGVPKIVYKTDESQFAAAYNASPTEFAYLEIGLCMPMLQAASAQFRTDLVYYARMYNYLTPSAS